MRDHHGFCDEWFVDDGQLVCTPEMFDPWLRAFDAAIEKISSGDRGTTTVVQSCRKQFPAECCKKRRFKTACVKRELRAYAS